MKTTTLILLWIVICMACNNGSQTETTNANMNDSNTSTDAAKPTPGLGNDPTRNDATKEEPIGIRANADSATQKGEAEPTPGLGNDPTRNDPGNTLSPPNENKNRKDTTGKRN